MAARRSGRFSFCSRTGVTFVFEIGRKLRSSLCERDPKLARCCFLNCYNLVTQALLRVDSLSKTSFQTIFSQPLVKSRGELFTGTGVAPLTSGWVCVARRRISGAPRSRKTQENRGLEGAGGAHRPVRVASGQPWCSSDSGRASAR